jgi:V/A-type H+-transporting ATPase subunit I
VIVRIRKVEIAGPRGRLEDVLACLQEMGVLQLEPRAVGFIKPGEEDKIRAVLPEAPSVAERMFLEGLRSDIDELFGYLSAVGARESYIEPPLVLDTMAENVRRHIEECGAQARRRETLRKEIGEVDRYCKFFTTLEGLFEGVGETPDLDFIGVTIKRPEAMDTLREALDRATGGSYELYSERAEDGSVVGLITTSSSLSGRVRQTLGEEQVPEFRFSPDFEALSFAEKAAHVLDRADRLRAELDEASRELEAFASRWGPIYKRVREWIDARLAVIGASASAFQTEMCFFVFGWIPADDVPSVVERLQRRFGGEVVLEEKELLEEDLERVPVILRNPPYFKPFEIFTRLLPLPRYTSYDPTPFVGIFFPVFFGMILGDAGYGLVLAISALIILKRSRRPGNLRDAAKILFVCGAYSVVFGILYGEAFGELGAHALGLKPLYLDRRAALFPLLGFALAVGIFHVLLGIVLGLVSAFRRKERKETLYKVVSLLSVMGIVLIAASLLGFFPPRVAEWLLMAAVVGVPLLIISGGALAPFEILKSVGNIISYARIMAIGLTSVMLAYVANRLGGEAGSIVLGILVGGLLHLLNILLGVFAPTIHSIRLHYVEFFGKFLEHGGRRFEPLKKH